MNYFKRIAADLKVDAALQEVLSQPELWNEHNGRTDPDWSPHHEVDDIWLRVSVPGPDRREAVSMPAMVKLIMCSDYIYRTAATLRADRIGRAFVSRLAPGGKIQPHEDIGPDPTLHYDNEPYYSRFHIVLQGSSRFYASDESVEMNSGELWWFDGTQTHWVENTGQIDRIHLFFDLRLSNVYL